MISYALFCLLVSVVPEDYVNKIHLFIGAGEYNHSIHRAQGSVPREALLIHKIGGGYTQEAP